VITIRWKCLRASAAILLVLSFFPSLSSAQTDKVLPKVLTLEEALNYALQHYPAVRASLEQVSAARAGVTLARTQYLPQLNGVYQVSRATQNQVDGIWLPTPITPSVEGPIGPSSGQSFWGSQAAALFSWEPLDFGLRSARVGQAQSAEEKSRADLALTRLQVATAVGSGNEHERSLGSDDFLRQPCACLHASGYSVAICDPI
jgi:outer membrane protein TolC